MDYLKQLMGSAYHEGLTIEEVNSFLANGKWVNLKDGNYVDKDKYAKLEAEKNSVKTQLDELTEKTKDYDTLKTENETYKVEKADSDLVKKLASLGINEKHFKYVKGDINDKTLVLGDDDASNQKAVKEYLEKHPEFSSVTTNPNPAGRVIIGTHVKEDPNKNPNDVKTLHDTINGAIRNAAGRKTESEQ